MAQSVQQAPKYQLYRDAVTAVDSLPMADQKQGINLAGYKQAHIQIIPSGGANPTVAVLWWSEDAGKFIQEQTPITKTGVGANTAYEFTVDARGRIMFVAFTTLASGSCKVAVAGFDLNNLL